ncbi:MAG: hypothetical protein WC553_03635 [Patescibacteria group bacterium]
MLEQLSEQLRHQEEETIRPNPFYGQVALVLALGLILTGWMVYGKVSAQIDQLIQKPVLAMEITN